MHNAHGRTNGLVGEIIESKIKFDLNKLLPQFKYPEIRVFIFVSIELIKFEV